ncbi:hypothetical protein CYMTET_24464, partial [Cymbomonas tetramitiformis]
PAAKDKPALSRVAKPKALRPGKIEWEQVLKMVGRSDLMQLIENYSARHLSPAVLTCLQEAYINDAGMNLAAVERACAPCAPLWQWVCAQVQVAPFSKLADDSAGASTEETRVQERIAQLEKTMSQCALHKMDDGLFSTLAHIHQDGSDNRISNATKIQELEAEIRKADEMISTGQRLVDQIADGGKMGHLKW